jgi:hypothetical protein
MRLLHLLAIRLHIGDEFLEVAGGEILARHDHHRRVGGEADRHEITLGIVADVRRQHRRRDMRAHRTGEQRIAVGLCGRDTARAERASGTADILDHQRLAKMLRHRLGDDAGHDVTRPARGERHDHGDRPRRIILRKCDRRQQQRRR